jgi:hypothetical protein
MDFPGKGNRKMKKLLFAVSALAALSLLAPSTGFAQHQSSANNQLGLFLNADGTGNSFTLDIGIPVTVYLVLINPTNDDPAETPYSTLNAFECTLNFTGPIPFKLGDTLPPTAINVGNNTDINNGFLEYIVGLGTSMDVIADAAKLITFQFLVTNPGATTITLTPTSAPSIAGEMAFQPVSGQLKKMYNAAGSPGAVVFTFNGTGTVATEDASFGSVKALFR